jgi:predicted molibdopterin-dependent oxidoreductase YjgC
MPTLTIDGRSVTVPAGSTILDAARALAIDVPTLCWYPKLPVVGNCRICLVQVEGAPKLAAACATAAADGMRVSTESDDAVKNRRGVLSMLLERYPAEDIPRSRARNEFESLVHRYEVPTARRAGMPLRSGDERDGDPIIQHDMSTCILCTRCVRACEDIQVVGVLDVAHRGDHAQIIVGADGNPEHAGCVVRRMCAYVQLAPFTTSRRSRAQRTAPRTATAAITAIPRNASAATATMPHRTREQRTGSRSQRQHAVMDTARAVSRQMPVLDRTVRSVSLLRRWLSDRSAGQDEQVIHVKSPWIEDDTPNQDRRA